eukprot:GILJ01003922.1.p1 GENE.GILJ01003922.1~~GILJ01003922.1.p1  ORF type:complete len:769 (-),score=158.91 GILJ01003922.1:88-2394(-)
MARGSIPSLDEFLDEYMQTKPSTGPSSANRRTSTVDMDAYLDPLKLSESLASAPKTPREQRSLFSSKVSAAARATGTFSAELSRRSLSPNKSRADLGLVESSPVSTASTNDDSGRHASPHRRSSVIPAGNIGLNNARRQLDLKTDSGIDSEIKALKMPGTAARASLPFVSTAARQPSASLLPNTNSQNNSTRASTTLSSYLDSYLLSKAQEAHPELISPRGSPQILLSPTPLNTNNGGEISVEAVRDRSFPKRSSIEPQHTAVNTSLLPPDVGVGKEANTREESRKLVSQISSNALKQVDSDWERRYKEAKSDYEKLYAAHASALKELESLHANVETVERSKEQLQNSSKDLSDELRVMARKWDTAEKQLEDEIRKTQAYDLLVNQLNQDKQILEQQLKSAAEQFSELTHHAQNINDAVTERDTLLTNQKAEYEQTIESLSKEKETLQEALEAQRLRHNEVLDQSKQELDASLTELRDMYKQNGKAQEQNKQLAEACAQRDMKLTQLQSDLAAQAKQHEEKVKQLQDTTCDLTNHLKEMSMKFDENTQSIKTQFSQEKAELISQKDAKYAELESRHHDLEVELAGAKSQISSLLTERVKLTSEQEFYLSLMKTICAYLPEIHKLRSDIGDTELRVINQNMSKKYALSEIVQLSNNKLIELGNTLETLRKNIESTGINAGAGTLLPPSPSHRGNPSLNGSLTGTGAPHPADKSSTNPLPVLFETIKENLKYRQSVNKFTELVYKQREQQDAQPREETKPVQGESVQPTN